MFYYCYAIILNALTFTRRATGATLVSVHVGSSIRIMTPLSVSLQLSLEQAETAIRLVEYILLVFLR